MQYQTVIKKLLLEQWQYFADKELLVLSLGDKQSLTADQAINADGYLKTSFKDEFSRIVLDSEITSGTVGPFGDDDYFSGIVDENDCLQYYFELHQMKHDNVLQFLERYPVIFIASQPEGSLD